MSLLDINQMSPLALLAQYVTETCGSTQFLNRDEILILEKWLNLSSDKTEEVILALEDILPKKLERLKQTKRKKVSLKSINKFMTERLQQQRAIQGEAIYEPK